MRWQQLFDDFEAQLAQSAREDALAQVGELTRHERSEVGLLDRVAGALGSNLNCSTPAGSVDGRLSDLGRDWLVLEEAGRGSAILPVGNIMSIGGLSQRSDQSSSPARRFTLGVALRAISRDRSPIAVHDCAAGVWVGTIDFVGSDHLEIALHPADAVRRASAVTGRRVIPWSAIAILRKLT